MNITVNVNGEARSVPDRTSLLALIEPSLAVPEGGRPAGIAIARNGEIVRRAEWDGVVLCDGDAIEIVKAAQGG